MQAAGAESEAAIARLFPRLHERPDLYLYAFEPITGTADLIVMDEADYARASFLNPGILTAQTLGARVALFRVIEAAEAAPRTRATSPRRDARGYARNAASSAHGASRACVGDIVPPDMRERRATCRQSLEARGSPRVLFVWRP